MKLGLTFTQRQIKIIVIEASLTKTYIENNNSGMQSQKENGNYIGTTLLHLCFRCAYDTYVCHT